MATPFETFITTELPVRTALFTSESVSYDDDPNGVGAPDTLKYCPKGAFFLQTTGTKLWCKKSAGTDTWEDIGSGGGGNVYWNNPTDTIWGCVPGGLVDNTTQFNAMVSALSSYGTVYVLINDTFLVSGSVSFPSNFVFIFANDGAFVIDETTNVSILGSIVSDNHLDQIFYDEGEVNNNAIHLAGSQVRTVYPQWWKNEASLNYDYALQSSINSVRHTVSGHSIEIVGILDVSAPLTVYDYTTIIGADRNTSIIYKDTYSVDKDKRSVFKLYVPTRDTDDDNISKSVSITNLTVSSFGGSFPNDYSYVVNAFGLDNCNFDFNVTGSWDQIIHSGNGGGLRYNRLSSPFDDNSGTIVPTFNDDSGKTIYGLGVCGIDGTTDVWSVGRNGDIYQWNNATSDWTQMLGGQSYDLYGIFALSTTDIWAVGTGGTILHYDGVDWTSSASGTSNTLYEVWGSATDDVWAVGENGTILHYNGTSWGSDTIIYVYYNDPGDYEEFDCVNRLNSIHGLSEDEIYIAGTDGLILVYDGDRWLIKSQHLTTDNFTRVRCKTVLGSKHILATTNNGHIYNGVLNNMTYWTEGTHHHFANVTGLDIFESGGDYAVNICGYNSINGPLGQATYDKCLKSGARYNDNQAKLHYSNMWGTWKTVGCLINGCGVSDTHINISANNTSGLSIYHCWCNNGYVRDTTCDTNINTTTDTIYLPAQVYLNGTHQSSNLNTVIDYSLTTNDEHTDVGEGYQLAVLGQGSGIHVSNMISDLKQKNVCIYYQDNVSLENIKFNIIDTLNLSHTSIYIGSCANVDLINCTYNCMFEVDSRFVNLHNNKYRSYASKSSSDKRDGIHNMSIARDNTTSIVPSILTYDNFTNLVLNGDLIRTIDVDDTRLVCGSVDDSSHSFLATLCGIGPKVSSGDSTYTNFSEYTVKLRRNGSIPGEFRLPIRKALTSDDVGEYISVSLKWKPISNFNRDKVRLSIAPSTETIPADMPSMLLYKEYFDDYNNVPYFDAGQIVENGFYKTNATFKITDEMLDGAFGPCVMVSFSDPDDVPDLQSVTASGSGNIGSGTYKYKCKFYRKRLTSSGPDVYDDYYSEFSNSVVVTYASDSSAQIDIENHSDTEYYLKIYRTKADVLTDFYELPSVDEIIISPSEVKNITDDVADDDLGALEAADSLYCNGIYLSEISACFGTEYSDAFQQYRFINYLPNEVRLSDGKIITYSSVPSSSGGDMIFGEPYQKGDVTYNSNPNSGDPFGWVCTSPGMSPTWGVISIVDITNSGVVRYISKQIGPSDIGTTLTTLSEVPQSATILSSSVDVLVAFAGGTSPTCAVFIDGTTPTQLQSTSDNDLTKVGDWHKSKKIVCITTGEVAITLGGSGTFTSGEGVVYVEYAIPLH